MTRPTTPSLLLTITLAAAACGGEALTVGSNTPGPGGAPACPLALRQAGKPSVAPGSNVIVAADLDSDHRQDLIVGSFRGDRSVLLGRGDGTFAPAVISATGGGPSVAVADFDGDGRPDLAATGGKVLSVQLGRGDGTFGAPVAYPTGNAPFAVAAGDLDGNGTSDIVAASLAGGGDIGGGNDTAAVLLGRGDGTFQEAAYYRIGLGGNGVVIADLDGDGKPDLAIVNQASDSVSVLIGRGDGTFQEQHAYASAGFPTGLAQGDLDVDGKPDLVATDQSAARVGILFGNGDGSFREQRSFDVLVQPTGVVAADMDRDGKLDLVLANAGSGNLSVLFGRGDGSFEPQRSFEIDTAAGTFPVSLAVADLNGDGRLDVAVARSQVNTVSVLLGDCAR